MALDTHGEPDAIGWNTQMRFGTGVGLLDFCLQLQVTLTLTLTLTLTYPELIAPWHQEKALTAEFPFLILHDPEDQIVHFGPSERLEAEAPSRDKQLIRMSGSKHDLISEEPEDVKERFTAWMLARV